MKKYKDEISFVIGTVNKFRNAINTGCGTFKKEIKGGKLRTYKCKRYTWDRFAMLSYNGEGFYVNNKEFCKKRQRIYGYDINWAYGSALIDYDFPLSNNIGDKPTKCGCYLISFTDKKPRYPQFYYTLYDNMIFIDKHKKYMWLTNLDYEIFTDLYESDAKILSQVYWQDIGPLPQEVHKLVKQAYIDKKDPNNKDIKHLFETCYYGMNAKDLLKEYNDPKKWWASQLNGGKNALFNAQALTGLNGIKKFKQQVRTEYCVISTWQTAYTRYREWKNFKANMDSVVYMNTDSIYSLKPLDLGEDLGLGYYKLEYNNEQMLFIRRNAYVVFNEDGNIKKSMIGGCKKDQFTKWHIMVLENGDSLKALSYDADHNLIEISLVPSFIKNVY